MKSAKRCEKEWLYLEGFRGTWVRKARTPKHTNFDPDRELSKGVHKTQNEGNGRFPLLSSGFLVCIRNRWDI